MVCIWVRAVNVGMSFISNTHINKKLLRFFTERQPPELYTLLPHVFSLRS